MTLGRSAVAVFLMAAQVGCSGGGPQATPSTSSTTPSSSAAAIATARVSASFGPTLTPLPSRTIHSSDGPIYEDCISLDDLSGRIVFDDFEPGSRSWTTGGRTTRSSSPTSRRVPSSN